MLNKEISVFDNESTEDTEEKQKVHSSEASKFIENHLKNTLLGLIRNLYKKGIFTISFIYL